MKDVLVGVPTFEGHDRWMEKFLEYHTNHDVMVVENTAGKTDYFHHLLDLKPSYPNLVEVQRMEWNPEDLWVSYMLGDCWNRTIDYALEHGYPYWHWTAMDIYVEDGGGIREQRKTLDAHQEIDVIGYPTNIFSLDGPPSVLHDAELHWHEYDHIFKPSFYTWEEVEKATAESPDGLFKMWGSIGFTLFRRKVIEKCRFKHPEYKGWVLGCDLFYLQEIHKQGFDYWCDGNHRAINHTKKDASVLDAKRRYTEKWMKQPEYQVMLRRIK